MKDRLQVGLVGAGLIGSRRAAVIHDDAGAALAAVADVRPERAQQVAERWGASNCRTALEWTEVVDCDEIDVVIVSTVNKFLAPITVAALRAGKHVLCEKPLGRNLREAQEIVATARASRQILKTGFNHRHHPAIRQAHQLYTDRAIGEPMFVRSVYGHGGRPGYEGEWRGDPDLAGGGELLDQGVHVVDLCRWFLGEFSEVFGRTSTFFWPVGSLEDNAFALLWTAEGRLASLHTSWTQWENRFDFEVYGRDGFLRVEGLGGSYGTERLTLGRRRPQSGPPEETTWEFPGPDPSWHAEWAEFTAAIRQGRRPIGDGEDGLQAMRLIDAIYVSAHTGVVVAVHDDDGVRAVGG
jgi:predicted dehydrogenase